MPYDKVKKGPELKLPETPLWSNGGFAYTTGTGGQQHFGL